MDIGYYPGVRAFTMQFLPGATMVGEPPDGQSLPEKGEESPVSIGQRAG